MITGQKTSTSQPLRGFANLHNDSNMKELATSTNVFFQQVTADLRPLDDDVTLPSSADHIPATEFTINQTEVECKLSEINIYKAPGPEDQNIKCIFYSYLNSGQFDESFSGITDFVKN